MERSHERTYPHSEGGFARKVAKLWQVIRFIERIINVSNRPQVGSGTRYAPGMARACNPVIRSDMLRGAVTPTELFGERASIGKS